MNKIHVTYKSLLLPITFIAATLISACDKDKIRGLASHRRRILYYLVGVLNHWQPSPMPKRL
ncbi:EnvF [Salmonella enterica subsp. enterica serovar Sanjuan]|uniref:EnvF n=1 Tax=Salmonella enterica subsp. enterica serovar Sanjuan TaxID=1160765 RepID=A0A3S5DBU5_SALET|nr:EnvF [Salmonella enterica subsp. enterica serovar Sanjuan]VEA12590.1 EnvF [Salmonella enterica subsp. enterica]